MTLFCLIRHASTDMPSDRLAGWVPGIHLNDRGREQARALAARMAKQPAACVYTSPLERAVETAEPVAAALGCETYSLDALGELRFGTWTDRPFAELETDEEWQRFNRFRSGTRLPEGDSFLGMQARAVEALLQLRAIHHHDARVVVVSHADVIKAIVMCFLSIPLDLSARLTIDHASITQLELSPDQARLWRLNDTAHIEDSEVRG